MGSLERFVKFLKLAAFLMLLFGLPHRVEARTSQKTVIDDVVDVKDFKKLLRTKNNVLVCFVNSVKRSAGIIKVFEESANSVRGQGTMVLVDCSGDAKKLCKKLKVTPDPHVLKHYKDGEFHKNYDRRETVPSMLNFMRDPTGDVPWEEDSAAGGIVHIPDATGLSKFLRKELGPVMIMFYAPWCGFCKQLKPEYAAAAAELKGHSILAAIDVNRPENAVIRSRYNITGFPTLIYFENGVKKYNYEGENNKDGLVGFMRNPSAAPAKPVETPWSSVDSEVVHLADDTFDKVVAESESILVMFYAPWCGHCKRLKPEYEKAADSLKQEGVDGVLAAVDATRETRTAKRFAITGYPTMKYFSGGEFRFDVSLRDEGKIVEFMREPKEPPPPPPPEKPWSEEASEVTHLTTETFKPFLKKKKHVLVMFYAPWCGHCKRAKPEFTASADVFRDDPKVEFAAVDCTSHSAICSTYDVKGYPTIKVFHYFNKEPVRDYGGQRTEKDFVAFMRSLSGHKASDAKSSEGAGKTALGMYDVWGGYDNFKAVVHLSDESFEKAVRKYDTLLVFFYVESCSECVDLKKEYARAARIWKKQGAGAAEMAGLDASAQKSAARSQNVSRFPVIKLYKGGRFVEDYSGRRDASDILEYASQRAGDSQRDEL